MNESTFNQTLLQRLETHFPCENPHKVYESMIAQAKEMYPEAGHNYWVEWVVFGLINEFNDKTLDFVYYTYSKSFSEKSAHAA